MSMQLPTVEVHSKMQTTKNRCRLNRPRSRTMEYIKTVECHRELALFICLVPVASMDSHMMKASQRYKSTLVT
jgi:hypothetical protein